MPKRNLILICLLKPNLTPLPLFIKTTPLLLSGQSPLLVVLTLIEMLFAIKRKLVLALELLLEMIEGEW